MFPYKWTLKDAKFKKDRGTVFSCFACGGGSTMGYKLAGFDVIGANEIDKSMASVYKHNHNPKLFYLEDIITFRNRKDLPKELFKLDILDGSPPCSTFSMSGKREATWGIEKKFREGQETQKLDQLFFEFIKLGKRLQPKVIIAENVKGLLLGNAKHYVSKIFKEFDLAGYNVNHYLLNSSTMGVPQRRERVFFIALRKDIKGSVVNLDFNLRGINFSEAEISNSISSHKVPDKIKPLYDLCKWGKSFSTVHPEGKYFNHFKFHPNKIAPTIVPRIDMMYHYLKPFSISEEQAKVLHSFPQDYEHPKGNKLDYVMGMSVPPVMMAQIAHQIDIQWLSKLKKK